MGNVSAQYCCNMDLGACAVYISRECICQRLCRAFLVPCAQCGMYGAVYSICKKDKERNARRNHIVWLYVSKISIEGGQECVPVPALRIVCTVNGSAAFGWQQDIQYIDRASIWGCHNRDGGDCVIVFPVFRNQSVHADRCYPDGFYAGRKHWFRCLWCKEWRRGGNTRYGAGRGRRGCQFFVICKRIGNISGVWPSGCNRASIRAIRRSEFLAEGFLHQKRQDRMGIFGRSPAVWHCSIVYGYTRFCWCRHGV